MSNASASVGQHLVSGGLSGLASTIFLQPLDLLKTRLQQTDNTRPATLLTIAKNVIKQDGVLGLWRGTVPSLCRAVPGVSLYMTSLTHLRAFMTKSPYFVEYTSAAVASSSSSRRRGGPGSQTGSVLPKLSNHGNLLAGAVTRVGVGFILNPFSVLKARFESNMYQGQQQYQSFPRAVATIFRSGPSELFRGFLPSAIRDAPYAGIFVAVYEGVKRKTLHLTNSTMTPVPPTVVHVLSAASAGAFATCVTHPFDVIKTKVQVRKEDRYHGLRRATQTIWRNRGVSGFFDGVSLRVSRKVLSSAIGWAVYEGALLLYSGQRTWFML